MQLGQFHTVYTPVAGFSQGSHFFTLNHLMEMSRFMDVTSGNYFTNNYHHGTLETLCRLVISLTICQSHEVSFFSLVNHVANKTVRAV